MDTQNELKEFFVNFFVPIDNIPEDTAWRNSISMEARASMLIDNASLEDLSSLFNVCINENVLTPESVKQQAKLKVKQRQNLLGCSILHKNTALRMDSTR